VKVLSIEIVRMCQPYTWMWVIITGMVTLTVLLCASTGCDIRVTRKWHRNCTNLNIMQRCNTIGSLQTSGLENCVSNIKWNNHKTLASRNKKEQIFRILCVSRQIIFNVNNKISAWKLLCVSNKISMFKLKSIVICTSR